MQPLAVLFATLTLAVPASGAAVVDDGPARSGAHVRSPLVGAKLWVDPDVPARAQAAAWRATRPADAARMDVLARTPTATWLGAWSGDVRAATDRVLDASVAAGRVPVFVAYDIPGRDCSTGYSGGGLASPTAYRAWVRAAAAGIGGRRAAVVVEPDALADLACLTLRRRTERLAMLRFAVATFAAGRRTAVYLDAGNSAWQPADVTAASLLRAGVLRADGFALNVSNFRTTASEVAYGRRLLARLGSPRGMGFVVDTSRNGAGPAPHDAWCNPAGRAIGAAPRTSTKVAELHALLWIKVPGESDGTCNGGPAAGEWWPSQALQLARR